MPRSAYVPQRGDIVHMDDGSNQAGHEQQGKRYFLVISHERFNKVTGLVMACPITTNLTPYNFKVQVHGRKVKGTVLCHQARAMDYHARKCQFAEATDTATLANVVHLVKIIID